MGDYTSYERKLRHREKMRTLCRRYIGLRVIIEFTPLAKGGRAQGRHEVEGVLVGLAGSATIHVDYAATLLLDEPDSEGRTVFLVNANHINDIRRKTFSKIDVAALLHEIGLESDKAPVDDEAIAS